MKSRRRVNSDVRRFSVSYQVLEIQHGDEVSIIVVLMIGAVVGALDGVGIFFAGEPYKIEIFLAAILKGVLVSLLTGLSLREQKPWWHGLGYGLVYGLASALVVFLAKGAFRSMDAPYVVPSGVVMGAMTGLAVSRFGFHRAQLNEEA